MLSVLSLLENTIEGLHSIGQDSPSWLPAYSVFFGPYFDCEIISLGSEEDKVGKRPGRNWPRFFRKSLLELQQCWLAQLKRYVHVGQTSWGLLNHTLWDGSCWKAGLSHSPRTVRAVLASGVSISCHLIQGSVKATRGPHVLP